MFWILWPYLVASITVAIYGRITKKQWTKIDQTSLRKQIAGITRDIMKPVSPK